MGERGGGGGPAPGQIVGNWATVTALPQSLAEAQPREEKAERRGLGPQALGPRRDSGLLLVGS